MSEFYVIGEPIISHGRKWIPLTKHWLGVKTVYDYYETMEEVLYNIERLEKGIKS